MKQIWKKYWNNLKSNRGFTMIELIITFVLTAILMTSAAMVLSSYMRSYILCNAMIQQKSISDILMETIVGELSQATDGVAYPHKQAEDVTYDKVLILAGKRGDTEKYDKILFVNKNGNNLEIAKSGIFKDKNGNVLEPGNILLRYTTYNAEGIKDSPKILRTVDWNYSDAVYKGNTVDDLTFEFVGSMPETEKSTILIKITLVLENNKTKSKYETSRIVECYNLKNSTRTVAVSEDMVANAVK